MLETHHFPPIFSRLPLNVSDEATRCKDALSAIRSIDFTDSRLPDIHEASLVLYYALFRLAPSNAAYANQVYAEAFNWSGIRLPLDLEHEWYAVAFRSVRTSGSNTALLYDADRAAHKEAVKSGGLLLYWYGSPTSEGHNLATCIWESRQDALKAMRHPRHSEAAQLAQGMYSSYALERYRLCKSRGRTQLDIEIWKPLINT